MQYQLEDLFDREVDLIEKESVESSHNLDSAQRNIHNSPNNCANMC
jgi:predicted nucleotidyltransferase